MNIGKAQNILKDMQKNCMKDWGDEPGHYNDPKKSEKAQALQFGIWGLQFYTNITRSTSAFEDTINNFNKRNILTKEEHDYLAAVIKPWRNKVIFIRKDEGYQYAYERVGFMTGTALEPAEAVFLPWFRAKEMYRGMKTGKRYSPEELGL